MLVKTMRYEIKSPLNADWNEFKKVLYELQYYSHRIKNRVIQMCHDWDNYSYRYFQQHGVYPDHEDVYGIKFDNYVYHELTNEFHQYNTQNLTTTKQKTMKHWKDNRTESLRGDISIPSFKRNNPIDLHNRSIRNLHNDKGRYAIDLGLISKKFQKEIGVNHTSYTVRIDQGNGSAKAILHRLLTGEYQIAASQIVGVGEGNQRKWFLNLCYKFQPEKVTVDPNRIMGIDMGVANAAVLAITGSHQKFFIGGEEIQHLKRKFDNIEQKYPKSEFDVIGYRDKVERHKKTLSRQRKYCGSGSIGHGRKTRTRPVLKIRDKIARYQEMVNDKYSRYIVDLAKKHGCGVIQVEDLSGIKDDDKRRKFLSNWTYFDLQLKIQNKAREYGIDFVKIDPEYTSQRCSKCGYIHKSNRTTQSNFECVQCGYKTHADYNAACNIGTKNIERIIKEQLKLQDHIARVARKNDDDIQYCLDLS